MPLPDSGSGAWPPEDLAPVAEQLDAWSAWYSGNPEQLANIYGGARSQPANRPSQYRGGVVGTMARWFWGAPTSEGERRTKLHVPLAGDIASTSSSLLFAEPPKITLSETGDQTTADRLAELLDETWHATLLEGGEVCSALGGVYLRVVWNKELLDRPWISVVHADNAVPEWTHGRLSAVTFWRVVDETHSRTLRHLERYEPGVILHGLYEGDADNLGRKIPLVEHEATKDLAASLTDGDKILTGAPGHLGARYVPNVRPNRMWRTVPRAVHLGRSDYAGVEGLLDAFDEVWTSWMRDIRIGKGRIHIPQDWLQSGGLGQGATFDADREVYAALNIMERPDGQIPPITAVQFAIRVDEHSRTAREMHDQIVELVGYSASTFGSQGDVAITATEAHARQRKSYTTRGHKSLYWKAGVADIVEDLLAIDLAQFGSGVTPERPTVEFPDGVEGDPEAEARTLQLLTAAEAISTETKVDMLHPDWDAPRKAAEVARILNESGQGDPEQFLRDTAANGRPPATTDQQKQGANAQQ